MPDKLDPRTERREFSEPVEEPMFDDTPRGQILRRAYEAKQQLKKDFRDKLLTAPEVMRTLDCIGWRTKHELEALEYKKS